MPEPVILIFDIGKTNKRYFLINEQYKIVHSHSEHFTESVDEDGFPCDDIRLISKWIIDSINYIIYHKDFLVKAINFSAYGASFVHLDTNGKMFTPLYNYLKPYPELLSKKFYGQYGSKDDIVLQTASPALGSLNSGMQLYRLKYEQPQVFSHIAYSLHLPQYFSFLVSRGAGSEITSIGCHTQLWDFKKNNYHHWVFNEQIDKKFPAIQLCDSVCKTEMNGQTISVGIGLHDSSAALIPYVIKFTEPFLLISTGTWNISLHPFNQTPLTIKELQQDCLCYISYRGKPVKASRLFAGHYHDKEVKRIATHFNVEPQFYKEIKFNPGFITKNDREKIKNNLDFEAPDLKKYNNEEEAYHQLLLQIVVKQTYSSQLLLHNSPVKKIIVEGGFSKNKIFMKLLSSLFPNTEVYAASIGEASAIGAALAIHYSWNKLPIPPDLIELVLEKK